MVSARSVRVWQIIGIMLMLSPMVSAQHAYTIDGDLSDWGVDLASAIGGTESAWAPDSTTAQWKVEDNIDPACTPNTGIYGPCVDWTGYSATGTHIQGAGPSYFAYAEPYIYHADSWGKYDGPAGGEVYDIEAMYFDDMNGYAFFGIVTSMPEAGTTDAWGRYTAPGDIAIDMDNNPATGMHGYEYGIKAYGPNKGQVCYMPVWSTPSSFTQNAPAQMSCDGASSVDMGDATLQYANAGISDNGKANYVIEVMVSKAMIGMPAINSHGDIHMTITCGNDVINLTPVEWHFNAPEFPSAIVPLLILAMAPLAAFRASRKD